MESNTTRQGSQSIALKLNSVSWQTFIIVGGDSNGNFQVGEFITFSCDSGYQLVVNGLEKSSHDRVCSRKSSSCGAVSSSTVKELGELPGRAAGRSASGSASTASPGGTSLSADTCS